MSVKKWGVLVVWVSILAVTPMLFGACSDDDDDDDDTESDFDDTTGNDDMDDDADDDADDDTDPNYEENPPAGACSCGGPTCEGCAADMSMLHDAGVLDDFATLNIDFGADEWGTDLGLLLDADVPVADLLCVQDLLVNATTCADAGVNCVFDDASPASCGAEVTGCVAAARAEFGACAREEGAVCAAYVDCALDCAINEPLTGPDACAASCGAPEPVCENLFDAAAGVSCFAGLPQDFSLARSRDDLSGVFARYASCMP